MEKHMIAGAMPSWGGGSVSAPSVTSLAGNTGLVGLASAVK